MIFPYISIAACFVVILLFIIVKIADRMGLPLAESRRLAGFKEHPGYWHLRKLRFLLVIVMLIAIGFGWRAYYRQIRSYSTPENIVVGR